MQLESTGVPMTGLEVRPNQTIEGLRGDLYVRQILPRLHPFTFPRRTIRKPSGNQSRPLQQYLLQIQQGQPTLDS